MNTLIEPFFYCLLASMIWAPLIFLGASFIAKNDDASAGALAGKIWPAALVIAALPVLLAPVAAALGLSLRTPAPLPPMAEPLGYALAADTMPPVATYAMESTVSLADILRTAAVLYFYGFLMLFVLAAVRHIWFAYRLNYAAALDEPNLEAALEEWRGRIGVTVRPRYVFSHIVTSVCVYGFFRPIIVMPFNLLDRVSIEDAALMGAHEMAHIKRGDVLLFALCSIAKAVFWFNPFMHQICARSNLAAEQGADALVLARGVNRKQYAHCFVQGLRLAANARTGFAGELIPSFTPFDKRSRRQRLDAILSGAPETPALNLPAKISLAASAAIAVCLACAQAAFAVAPPAMKDALPVAPVKGEITLGYGETSKLLGAKRIAHEGVDIKAPRGEPVHASGAGKVIDATDKYRGSDNWGKVVVIDHGHGLVTRYAHLDSYSVRKGDQVDAGEVIGAVGATGVVSGPHLHFEVIVDGKTVDPEPVAAVAPIEKRRATSTTRRVDIAPTPVVIATPENMATASSSSSTSASSSSASKARAERDERRAKERKQEKKLQKLEERLREQFANFDAFSELEGKTLRFNDLDFSGFEGSEEFAKLLEGKSFSFQDFADFSFTTPDMSRAFASVEWTAEDMEAMREAQEEAMEAAAEAMEQARESIEEARLEREEAIREERERVRELKQAERERVRELRQAERERHAEIKQQMREAEHQRAEAARERAEAMREFEREREQKIDEVKMLEMREQALRDARQDLDEELAEIKQRRKELERAAEQAN